MGMGKILAIIGAVVGIASVLLSIAAPALFSWYHLEVSGGESAGLYLTAFGTFVEDNFGYPVEIITLVLIGGILVLLGAGLCIIGGLIEQKVLGIIGGILMIVGPTMLIFDLSGELSEFSKGIKSHLEYHGGTIFYGTYSPYPGISVMWGVWIGYFLAYAGGVLGLIGGAKS